MLTDGKKGMLRKLDWSRIISCASHRISASVSLWEYGKHHFDVNNWSDPFFGSGHLYIAQTEANWPGSGGWEPDSMFDASLMFISNELVKIRKKKCELSIWIAFFWRDLMRTGMRRLRNIVEGKSIGGDRMRCISQCNQTCSRLALISLSNQDWESVRIGHQRILLNLFQC